MIEILQSSAQTIANGVVSGVMLIATSIISNFNTIIAGISGHGASQLDALVSFVVLALQLGVLLLVLKVLEMIWILSHEMRFLWQKPKSYSVLRTGGKRILVIGDSTAYGTGADKPEDTISGRLGRDFPNTEIINTAVGGSLTGEAIDQLHRASGKFDLIIICTGGNDIWHFSKLSSLEEDLTHLLQEALVKSGQQVILLFYANMGSSPIFPGFLRALLAKRTQQIHEIFSSVATRLRVPLVELYTNERVDDFSQNPFVKDPEIYYSEDRMHPSSEGYRLWYNHMWREMVAHHFTFAESNPTLVMTHEQ